MIKLKKGSQAAKNYMAKIRAMRKGVKKAVKKSVKRKLNGNPRRETQHQDTKSHNVNIRVLSGINELDKALKEYNNIHKAIDFNNKVIRNPKKYGNIAVKLNKVLLLSNKKMLVLKRKEIVNIKKHI